MNADDRRELVKGFGSVLQDALPIDAILEASLDGQYPNALRATLAEMGWFDLALEEDADGLGLEVADLASLCLVTGHYLLPKPLMIEAFVMVPVLAAAGDAGAAALASLRSGASGGGGAVVAPASDDGALPPLDGMTMSLAPDAAHAVVLGADSATIVEVGAADVERLPGTDLVAGQSRVSGEALITVDDIGSVRQTWLVCLLADCIGAAQASLDLSLKYAQEREQFGTPIAKFQAISHMLADMRVDIELSLSSLSRLVHLAESDAETADEYLVSMMHSIPRRARAVCERAIQVHGGMGFTWEAGIHLFYRRVLQAQAALGGAAATGRHAGRLLVDSATP
jgi:alkylation response protein AidB-like acyl-CoA dehydrogenase